MENFAMHETKLPKKTALDWFRLVQRGHAAELSKWIQRTAKKDANLWYVAQALLRVAAANDWHIPVQALTFVKTLMGKSCLQYAMESAIKTGAGNAVRVLLSEYLTKHHLEYAATPSEVRFAFMHAVVHCQAGVVQQLLQWSGGDVKYRPTLEEMLFAAAYNGGTRAVTTLLRAKASVNASDASYANTALVFAASAGNLKMTRTLVAAKSNVNHRRALDNQTALHFCAQTRGGGGGGGGGGGAQGGAQGGETETTLKRRLFALKLLVQSNADIHAKQLDTWRETPLAIAKACGFSAAVTFLSELSDSKAASV
jgi:hypothetical protein